MRWNFREAFRLATEIENNFADTPSAQNAKALKAQIMTPSLNLAIEQVQLPKKHALGHVSFRNVEEVYFRIVEVDPERDFNRPVVEVIPDLLRQTAAEQWSVELPNAGDHQQHTTEFILPALDLGRYYLIASADPDFPAGGNHTVLLEFWVSQLSTVYETDQAAGELSVMVIDRANGSSVPNAQIYLWESQRDRGRRQLVRTRRFITDTEGRVVFEQKELQDIMIQVISGEDQLFLRDRRYLRVGNRQEKEVQQIQFFTDRGLYRPGQTVYFKGLVTVNESRIPRIVPNEKVEVSLMDANRQEVETLTLTTNRFGSISGQFTLPQGGLLGRMSLYAKPMGTWYSLRVEEYKRPRFAVEVSDLEDEPALNKTITIKGTALSYAGPAIEDAEVKYTVMRSVRRPWYSGYAWRRFSFERMPEQTVTVGTTRTDAAGAFDFEFMAEADADISADFVPDYTFRVNVEVVDGTGETRSTNKLIPLTKHPFMLQLSSPEAADRLAGVELSAACKNLAGAELTKTVSLSVIRLQTPTQNYNRRYWNFPDTVSISERTFRKRLPQFAYAKNELAGYWPDAGSIDQRTFELTGTDTIRLATVGWQVGHYKAVLLVVTEEGDTLRTETKFRLDDWRRKEFATGTPIQLRAVSERKLEPGQQARLMLANNEGPVSVWGRWRNMHSGLAQGWQSSEAPLHFDLTERERGGLAWQGFYVWNNRYYSLDHRWLVPWSNKKLDIQFETFRSKLYPGQDEEWTLRIDGPDKDAVSAEVLASMYDASLDQILPFTWRFRPFGSGVNGVSVLPLGFQQRTIYIAVQHDNESIRAHQKVYPRLQNMGSLGYGGGRGAPRTYSANAPRGAVLESEANTIDAADIAGLPTRNVNAMAATTAGVMSEDDGDLSKKANEEQTNQENPPAAVRTNLAETAFFYPQLATDENGKVVLKFKSPESLTSWKLQVLTHDADLAYALQTKEVVTQKELMVLPNAPRVIPTQIGFFPGQMHGCVIVLRNFQI
ncbi:MAG: MG2 domain-containing protein [Pseudomonadota bacterium]